MRTARVTVVCAGQWIYEVPMTTYVVPGRTPAQDEWGGALIVVGAEAIDEICRPYQELTMVLPDGEEKRVMVTFAKGSPIQFRGIGGPPASMVE